MSEFALRYARWMRPLLAVTGLGPRRVSIELSDTELRVRAGVWFRATVPRSSVNAVQRRGDTWAAIGVHTNFRGTWLVNGSPGGIVVVDIDPPVRARGIGCRVKLKRLGLSLEDPDRFISACAPPTAS